MEGNSGQVVVTDIKIPFWSMVVLMVKWALAAIPAIVILIVIGSVTSAVLGLMFGGMFDWQWGPRRMM